MYEILLSCLGWCPQLLFGIVRQATKMDMQGCWSLTCCFSGTLGSLSKCGQLKSFLQVILGRCSSELAQLVPLCFSRGRSSRYSDKWYGFSVAIPRCYKDVYVNSFFPGTVKLWNSLTYDASGFKSRINRHLVTVGSF